MSVITGDSGYLEIILGPMFSGKTTALIEIHKKCIYCHIPVVVINHCLDNRYHLNSTISTHDSKMIKCIPTSSLSELLRKTSNYYANIMYSDVILINEAQFFPDLYSSVLILLKHNKKVYISGLDGDYKRKKIGQILDLIPYADKVSKLTSYCSKCRNGTPGIFSMRKTSESDVIVIGGADKYETVCRNCYEDSVSDLN